MPSLAAVRCSPPIPILLPRWYPARSSATHLRRAISWRRTYTIDSSDVSTTETQAQTNYTQALKAKYPTADISGTVSEVYVSNGDAVSAGTELCRISASNDLTIDFQFSYAKDGDFYVGQPQKFTSTATPGILTVRWPRSVAVLLPMAPA